MTTCSKSSNWNMMLSSITDQLRTAILHEDDHNSSLCGFPGVCLPESFHGCLNTTLRECSSCGELRGTVFVIAVSIMSFLILVGNSLVIASLHYGGKEARNRFMYTKVSLAVADLMNGIQILVVTLPNYVWTMQSTAVEIAEIQLMLRGSRKAVVGGFFFTLIYTSSLYHLLLISIQRFIAVQRPLLYKVLGNKSTYWAIACVWIMSMIVSSVPGWLPDCFVFTYVVNTFLYAPSFTSNFALELKGKALLSLCFIVPYIVMSGLTFATGLTVWKSLNKSNKLSSASDNSSNLRRQYDIIKTLVWMELGFTITLLPNAVVALLYYYEVLDCDSISVPLLITFYISTSNSLVNVIIYSCRDKTFRKAMKEMRRKCCCSGLSCGVVLEQVRNLLPRNRKSCDLQRLELSVASSFNNLGILSVSKQVQNTNL